MTIVARARPASRRALGRARRAPRRIAGAVGRSAALVTGASRAHRAPLPAVAVRAARMVSRGWHLRDLALLGLLDPEGGPAREAWAVRRSEILELQEALNPLAAVGPLEDKRRFAVACGEHALATAPMALTLVRSPDPAVTARDWARALEGAAPDELVVKPAVGERGTGVRVLRRTRAGAVDGAGRALGWDALADELASSPWPALVVQPRLHPHPELLRLTGQDVLQCLRIVTLVDAGRPRVVYAALRIAVAGNVVDSFRSESAGVTGNLLARVQEGGRLAAPFAVAPGGYGLVRVDDHPQTGARLTGAAVPDWQAAQELACRAAEAFQPLRTVGWDVACTPSGPLLLEGNAWWGATADPDGALLPVRAALRDAARR